MKQSLVLHIGFLFLASFLAHGESGVEVINAGVGGDSTVNLLKRVEKAVISRSPSAVVIMAGTNDRLNSRKFVSAESYRKNILTLIQRIEGGGARVILVSPPPCIEKLLLTRHDPAEFVDHSPNERMLKVRGILLEISKTQKVPLVDLHQHLVKNRLAGNDKGSVLKNPKNGGGKDGVHFTPRGYKIMAELVVETIRSEKIDPSKIVCFGDSITFGAGVKGAGTVEGETYPAYLQSLLKE